MFGNDIVDLRRAEMESNWRREGYLEKICTLKEQKSIQSSDEPDRLFWSYWSIKEAVYKAYNRSTSNWEWAPSKIRCEFLQKEDNKIIGTVQYHGKSYWSRTFIEKNRIHTVSGRTDVDFSDLKVIAVNYVPTDYTLFLREQKAIATTEEVFKNELRIPFIKDVYSNSTRPLSISHHGDFFGVIFLK